MATSLSGPKRVEPFPMDFIKGVADILAQTEYPGLSNSEIDALLPMAGILQREAGRNKRESLYITLNNKQYKQGLGNSVVVFINMAMSPARYMRDPNRFAQLSDQLSEFLVHYGYRINDRGQLARGTRASTLSEAAELAGTLHAELRRRGTHDELFRYCAEEFVTRSLFHAISEASKSIPTRVRQITGLAGDGDALYNGVFGTRQDEPLLYMNRYENDSDISEHRGFKNLLLGIHGHYRNPRAHSNRVDNTELLPDFYDAFSLFSYVHRRLDTASRQPIR
ncbi:hypothetical protein MTES_0227 [Microbacterium testaceum StLB037]|uniref:Conserved hypothetical protein CHP02391 domain-containing protein n=1 Tax=Microbacterium testaceum (strain StLB037) TaxID=979556 RepID=E8N8Y2_MICTS|nr:TIGR02391 family protein [Microbacterium testaceum]BAJ73191.1 hypothetical protein MTES_0227 [Microbacterium testaceum StLB037]